MRRTLSSRCSRLCPSDRAAALSAGLQRLAGIASVCACCSAPPFLADGARPRSDKLGQPFPDCCLYRGPGCNDAQIKEQVEILGEFYAKSVNKSDLKVLADVGDYQVRHMTNAMKGHTKLGPEKWELIKKAIAKFKFAAVDGSKKTKGVKAA